ncbi:MAG: CRISPR-associated helicase Cas3' [Armatimonadetes bacterium]|nr:CRISPR-associated helicase Cas3' [Armatimonadota bacterium]
MTTDPLLALWGKTDRENDKNYHPLLFHLLDVAHCALELWNRLPNNLRSRMANAIQLDERQAGLFFASLAGLHDIGKAYPCFQNKAPNLLLEMVEGAGFDVPTRCMSPHPHNFVSVPEVKRLFESKIHKETLLAFAHALGAHHGVFPTRDDIAKITPNDLGVEPIWEEARNRLSEEVMTRLAISWDIIPPRSIEIQDSAFIPLLAAFISIADWFGSSKHFPMDGAQDIAAYVIASKRCAKAALDATKWSPPPVITESLPFSKLFDYLNPGSVKPNALQKRVANLLEGLDAPSLWIIEEEMGAGKTEAAFSILDACRVKGLAHGVYVAMPTQATSNAMYKRLGDYLRTRDAEQAVNLILAHSHAILDNEYRDRIEFTRQFDARIYNNDERANDTEGTLLVRSWFTARKQTLLAHYGVGTIDQALMGVLQTRHWFVRLFGLAGKVVIFDEVHAYDTYMNTLLAQLIKWLAELDCTVILLSATLPRKARLELAEAYCGGAKEALVAQTSPPAYPRITCVPKGSPQKALAHPIPPNANPKTVRLEHLPNSLEAVLNALRNQEGCAIVVCNTVAKAQEMYRTLEAVLSREGWKCLLFHARMPFGWRKEREERVLELFDKHSGKEGQEKRLKTLLVATQVVEQSLDLDADIMVSEMAPVDLILQRMGRLFRHKERERYTQQARFILLCDTESETALPNFGNSTFIYEEYVLLRSWLALREKSAILLPNEIEPLVSEVYEQEEDADIPNQFKPHLLKTKKEMQNKITNDAILAEEVLVKEPCRPRYLFEQKNRKLVDEDNPRVEASIRASTRLAEPNVRVICRGSCADGTALAPLNLIPKDMEDVIKLMSFEVSIQSKALVFAILALEQPDIFKSEAHLRYHYALDFQAGIPVEEGLRGIIGIDPILGLIERKKSGNSKI